MARAALPAAVDGQPLPSLAPMLETVTPAVVNIHSRTVVRVRSPLADDPFFRHFFGLPSVPRERVQQSLGSGVIVDAEQGLLLTNNHVIEGADDIQVTLADGRTLAGEFVGADPDTDVALVRIPAENLSAVRLADPRALRVGDFVVAVGNPFGLGQTVTSGIVSALGRQGLSGLGYQNFIQTDASINPGNSGGALVNLRGELVGVNTAIFSPSGGNVGIGFAIPVGLATDVMRQLLAFGEVRRGSLGVESQDIDAAMAKLLGVTERRGAVITRVQEDSPADQAGLKPGDVVVAIDGTPVPDRQSLHNAEGLLPVDKPVRIAVLREGNRREMEVVLKARVRELDGALVDARLEGARLAELPERMRQRGARGVRVEQVAQNSRAARNGLRPGDLIVATNRRDLSDLAELQRRLDPPPAQLVLTLVRGRGALLAPMQ
ncbi:Do family serine endopeptidase [Lysobacter sp. CAU 1642]|uniref:Do family serine endopeptidase n=2 Tax=Pseudomarimonas salicorniae TaxID=2933270 RepID=A0ABT0GLU1_9GAMM|nr:Do family serine endopeptidase [Lysobacter sp. CAU 1642]MCK7595505.1 Do family serine endopeptidase [Lysobacter sp. CAU 1642]